MSRGTRPRLRHRFRDDCRGRRVLSPPGEERFGEALARLLRERYPEPMVIEHRVRCVVAGNPKTAPEPSVAP